MFALKSVSLAASLLVAYAGVTNNPWGYHDDLAPQYWSKTFPLCGGDTQSGIDIITETTVQDESVCRPMYSADWTLANTTQDTYRVVDYGNSIAFQPIELSNDKKKEIDLNQNTNAIGQLTNQFVQKFGIHEKFCFHSFHFHWGTINEGGSEHNVNGMRFPLEVHFVHYSCDYHNLTEALDDKAIYDKYVLGVVGVLFEFGSDWETNEAFERILEAKEDIGKSGKSLIKDLNVTQLLPKNMDFYAYEGSLTTPPCLPVVRWHVMKETVKISRYQLQRLQGFLHTGDLTISQNYRPVQENKNTVYDCSVNEDSAFQTLSFVTISLIFMLSVLII